MDSIARVVLALHTIRKCKKMAGQNTFPILFLNDANMIGEHFMFPSVLLSKIVNFNPLNRILRGKITF